MGRMLDTLNQPAVRPEAPIPVPPSPAAPIPELKLATPEDDAIPYIEVGGSGNEVDASPQVLACPVPSRLLRPKPAAPAKPIEAPPTKTVEFRPASLPIRPAPPPPRRIAPELVAFHRPDDPVSGEYQAILDALLDLLPPGRPALILFTALSPWAGTTTVVLNLAVTAARQQRRTVVVDCNSRRPAVAERLGLDPTPGWRDLAAGTVPAEHAVQDAVQPYLHVLTAGRPGAGVDYPITAAAAAAALAPLREHADLILLDSASWNEGDEAAALASVCDGVVVVLDSAQIGATGKIDPLPWLRQPPARLLGCITARK